ncbi:MAG: hypothetical protein CBC35_10325 [Planctomycetes bacterium TMED75]|nr:hypothetical protein [Planctomycetaceae bacterium]OUU91046.1 MAG: hypothetical protein CBC35_10325 [Planctomycetes bacterium TMED75]
MSASPPPPAHPPPPIFPGRVVSSRLTHFFAWFLMSLVVLTMVVLNYLGSQIAVTGSAEDTEPLGAEFQLVGKMIVGAQKAGVPDEFLQTQLVALKPLTLEDRLAKAILREQLGDLEGALDSLESVEMERAENEADPSDVRGRLLDDVSVLLFALASGERAAALNEDSSARLKRLLPFYGPLLEAEATRDRVALQQLQSGAMTAVFVLLGVGLWYLLALGFGCVFLLCFLLSIWVPLLKGFRALLFDPSGRTGSVYLETFALWLLAFFGLSFLIEFVMMFTRLGSAFPELNLLGSMIAMFASLFVLYWPRVRGVTSAQLRQHCGFFKAGLIKEIGCGFLIYTTAIPLLVCGLMLSQVLVLLIELLFGTQPPPSHPVTELLEGSVFGLVLVYLLACVAAPIVEEIMFRGVLYRYLREYSRGVGLALSFLFSALISSFIFAAIHPQGLAFIPVLGALAVAFCLGREWRGSLVAPIVAHAVNNLVTVTLGLMLLG